MSLFILSPENIKGIQKYDVFTTSGWEISSLLLILATNRTRRKKMLPLKTISAILALCSSTNALPVDGLTERGLKVLGLDFEVQRHQPTTATDLVARKTVQLPLTSERTYYLTYLLVGENKQKIGVTIDTGSGDLWVPNTNTSGSVTQFGVFDSSKSSTFKDTGVKYEIGYYDGTKSVGDFVTDTVALADGSGQLENFQFASIGQTSVRQSGVLGLGTKDIESTGDKYNNLPWALKEAGYINTAAYSLYFDSADASSGTILFGGIDTKKVNGNYIWGVFQGSEPTIQLNSVTLGGNTITVNSAMILDSGTSYSFLPTDAYNALIKQLGGDGTLENGYATVPCNPTGNLSYNFNGLTIDIPLTDLVKQWGDGHCYSTINPGPSILGDTFLRHAYVGINLSAHQVLLGKPAYSSETNIEPYWAFGNIF